MLFHELSQQGEQLRELGAQRRNIIRKQQFNATVGGSTRLRRPESMKRNLVTEVRGSLDVEMGRRSEQRH